MFRLIDSFFYLDSYWNKKSISLVGFWQNKSLSAKLNTWAGYAFENFCLLHIDQIVKNLEINGLVEAVHFWRTVDKNSKGNMLESGAQIDLIIERSDGVLHIVEIKYTQSEFVLKKDEAKNILNKVDKFIEKTKYKGQEKINLITPVGIKNGLWNDEVFDKVITLKAFN